MGGEPGEHEGRKTKYAVVVFHAFSFLELLDGGQDV